MAGGNDYIEKPFSRDLLIEIIRKHFFSKIPANPDKSSRKYPAPLLEGFGT